MSCPKKLVTSRGNEVLVDDDVYEWLQHHNIWESGGYARIFKDGKRLRIHQAMGMSDHDHINQNKYDNRRDNLRPATKQQNSFNTPKRANNSTGYKGVRLHRDGRYEAQISAAGKSYYLGLHDTPEQASAAYEAKAKELHGEFYATGEGQ